MQKLKTTLLGAALVGYAFAGPAMATPHNVGTLSVVGAAPAAQQVHFDVFLPLRHVDKLEALVRAQQDPKSTQYHKWLTPAQFGAKFGPDRATLSRVADALHARGFSVKTYTRSVRATGTVDQVNRNFGVHLLTAQSEPGSRHIVTNESFRLPAELSAARAHIYSFAPHAAHTHAVSTGKIDNRYSDTGPYWFTDLKQAYTYPAYNATATVNGQQVRLDGTGAKLGALMSSDVLDTDIQAIFDHEHWSTITHTPDPKLAGRVYVNGGAPFNPNSGASFEASLDVQQELTATGAKVVLYDIPDLSDGNVMAGYVDAIEQNYLDVLSSSFGECELFYLPEYNGGQDYSGILKSQHELFLQGNSQGMTFLASSGDSAGLGCPSPSYFTGGPAHFVAGVEVPASDPNVTAVGGTNLVTVHDGTLNSAYVGENGWTDPEHRYDPYGIGVPVKKGYWGAGGGYSSVWSAPDYQGLVQTGSDMRAVPDIGMQVGGCPFGLAILDNGVCDGGNQPQNGNGNSQRSAAVLAFAVGQGGGFYGVIGTSVSSPEFASVVADLVQQGGRQGNLNPYIYQLANQQKINHAYHTNIPGWNGVQDTTVSSSYSLATGVGTPYVTRFIGQPGMPHAKVPQTRSNP